MNKEQLLVSRLINEIPVESWRFNSAWTATYLGYRFRLLTNGKVEFETLEVDIPCRELREQLQHRYLDTLASLLAASDIRLEASSLKGAGVCITIDEQASTLRLFGKDLCKSEIEGVFRVMTTSQPVYLQGGDGFKIHADGGVLTVHQTRAVIWPTGHDGITLSLTDDSNPSDLYIELRSRYFDQVAEYLDQTDARK